MVNIFQNLFLLAFVCLCLQAKEIKNPCAGTYGQAAREMLYLCSINNKGITAIDYYASCMHNCFHYDLAKSGKEVMNLGHYTTDLTKVDNIYKEICERNNLNMTCWFQRALAKQQTQLGVPGKIADSTTCALWIRDENRTQFCM